MVAAGSPISPPLRYIERTRDWYAALGYAPYRWSRFDEVPFVPSRRPLARSRIALLTTAAPYRPELGPQGAGAPYNAAAKFYAVYSLPADAEPDLRVSHVAIDRECLGDDSGAWLPLHALRRAAARGRIGAIAPRLHGVPTRRSQRDTLDIDAPEVLARCRDDTADAALLVPNCPVCHQSMALVARTLEAAGIATVIVGAARDVVEHVGAARLLFSDLPLGNAAGLPHDAASQDLVVELALQLLESATVPRTTRVTPLRWPGGNGWKDRYLNPARLDAAALARERDAHERTLAVARSLRAG